MKLVSAAKLRKAQEAVERARDYTSALTQLLAELSEEQIEFTHPLLESREEVKKVRVLVIGAGRGLCGGYVSRMNKELQRFFKELPSGVEGDGYVLGKKSADFFRRAEISFHQPYTELPENAAEWPVEEVCKELELSFLKGEVDEVYLIYTKFKSAMSMEVQCDKLLPMGQVLAASTEEAESKAISDVAESFSGITKFEPSAEAVFESVVPRILRTQVRQAALNAKAGEHGSRMTAMDTATKNADDLSDGLKLKFNKLRQSGITSELLDILGGAEAVQG